MPWSSIHLYTGQSIPLTVVEASPPYIGVRAVNFIILTATHVESLLLEANGNLLFNLAWSHGCGEARVKYQLRWDWCNDVRRRQHNPLILPFFFESVKGIATSIWFIIDGTEGSGNGSIQYNRTALVATSKGNIAACLVGSGKEKKKDIPKYQSPCHHHCA